MEPKRYSEDSVLRAVAVAMNDGTLLCCDRRDDTTKPTWTVQLFGDGTYLDVSLDELAGIVHGIAAQKQLDSRTHRVDARDFVGYEDDSACSGGFGVRVFAQDGAHSKLLYGGREVECARIVDSIAAMLVTWPGWYDSAARVVEHTS